MHIIYARGEDFTNELISYLAEKNMQEFHNKYRCADVLLIDDVQFIAGKIQTQEEFFHTFDTLHTSGKQVVLTSDRPPKEILTLEERLRTRFEWGLLADIQPPGLETRMAIVKRKAETLNLELSEDVTEFIADKLKNDIRQLEGVVKKLKAYGILDGQTPSLMLAQRAIKDIMTDNQPVPVTIEKIITEVSRTFGSSYQDIISKKSDGVTSKARHAAMYIIREVLGLSMKNIGSEFGGKDHTTVLYAIKKIKSEMQKNAVLKATIQDMINNLKNK
jgi:chromosomal replication initiator protein